jgi:L-methionine (R)-S-oxide reductase
MAANVVRMTWSEVTAAAASVPAADRCLVDAVAKQAVAAGADGGLADEQAAGASPLLTYRVPVVTDDGMCSRADVLAPQPMRLAEDVYAHTHAGVPLHRHVARLTALYALVKALAAAVGVEWLGVYLAVPAPPAAGCAAGVSVLVKEAYVGAPSRAYFPLTPDFAEHSNNSTVALTRQAIIIHDTRRLNADTPYYVCDGKVRSELCAPIVSPAGQLLGILDAEAWGPAPGSPGHAPRLPDRRRRHPGRVLPTGAVRYAAAPAARVRAATRQLPWVIERRRSRG